MEGASYRRAYRETRSAAVASHLIGPRLAVSSQSRSGL